MFKALYPVSLLLLTVATPAVAQNVVAPGPTPVPRSMARVVTLHGKNDPVNRSSLTTRTLTRSGKHEGTIGKVPELQLIKKRFLSTGYHQSPALKKQDKGGTE